MPFHSDSVYFLDVSPTHMFCRLDLLDLINKNWPDLLNDFKINGISNPKGIAKSDNEYSALRKSNSNSIIYLPSTNEFIIAPGLGLTFGGTSIANQESAIRIIKRITELDRKFFQNTSVQLLLKDNYIIVENPQENVKEEINIYYCD